jgi:predicted ATPase
VALTPMDARDLKFVPDPSGRVHLVLVEENGQETSAYSASDGTLRFLAMVAALLGPQPAAFYFFEELDNGIHPARLHLLLELIEQQVARGGLQVVTTTHSPELLMLLRPATLGCASLTYRLPESSETGIHRLVDIPEAQRVMKSQDLWRLHTGGWFERALHLAHPDEDAR